MKEFYAEFMYFHNILAALKSLKIKIKLQEVPKALG